MQQRQLRLGDILDDYCPRERRVTNHAVVAMVGQDVKQTRCTTCDAEHEYKHAKVPRQRRKSDTPAALYSQVLANGPKRVIHEGASANGGDPSAEPIDEQAARRSDRRSRAGNRGDASRIGQRRRRGNPTNMTKAANRIDDESAERVVEASTASGRRIDGAVGRRVSGTVRRRGPGASAADSRVAAASGRSAAANASAAGIHHSPARRSSESIPSSPPARRSAAVPGKPVEWRQHDRTASRHAPERRPASARHHAVAARAPERPRAQTVEIAPSAASMLRASQQSRLEAP